jgi:hypothetical protein
VYVKVSAPEEVTGEFVTVNKEGAVSDTLVTVPTPGDAGVAHTIAVPPGFVVKTWPGAPTAKRPVPPELTGRL